MKAVHKYEVYGHAAQHLMMPKGAVILSVGNQYEKVQIWAEVERHAPTVQRRILVLPTGYEFNDEAEFERKLVGRVDLQGGALIFHVFDCEEVS